MKSRAARAVVLLAVVLGLGMIGFGTPSPAAADGQGGQGGQERPVLRVGTEGTYPPFSYEDDGTLTGYDIDVMRAVADEAGYDVDRVLTTDDLVRSDDVFVAATGVTTGALLRGVRYVRDGAITDSIVMRSRSGTVRRIEARHQLSKLTQFTGREY